MRNLVNTISKVSCLFLFATANTSLVYADDITDSINEGLKYYKDGQYSDAATSLNYASQLIQQKKGGSLKLLFPEPLSGWKAEDATSETSGAAFGVGISAEREYNKGQSAVTIEIVADSPMLQGVMMMLSNPMISQADGGKLIKVGGQKAIVKYDSTNKSGDIQVVVANRFLVSINGDGVTNADLTNYAKAVDYKKIAALP